ncbi:unnamed protein product [Lampetra planeri]
MKAVVARVEGGGRVQEEEAIPDRPHLAPLRLALPGRSLAARSRRQSSRERRDPHREVSSRSALTTAPPLHEDKYNDPPPPSTNSKKK